MGELTRVRGDMIYTPELTPILLSSPNSPNHFWVWSKLSAIEMITGCVDEFRRGWGSTSVWGLGLRGDLGVLTDICVRV